MPMNSYFLQITNTYFIFWGYGLQFQSYQDKFHVYLWLIHIDVWQKPSQYCKVIILQLNKINFLKKVTKCWQGSTEKELSHTVGGNIN